MPGMLESEEAARRLGVKLPTLYAYVSRGLLVSHPAPSGRRRLFERDEVERLAHRSRQGRAVETRMVTVTTGVTQLSDQGPLYRGRTAADLATRWTFEEVAEWLWGDAGQPQGALPGDSAWRPADTGPPPELGTSDRIRWAVVMAGAHDPVRADLRPEAVVRAARGLAAAMGAVVAARSAPAASPGPAPRGVDRVAAPQGSQVPPIPLGLDDGRVLSDTVAGRLTAGLTPQPTPAMVRAVNAALVLLADHELATSTVAVRVAASTRADVYDALLAGLGTLAGPLHGGASQLAHSLLVHAERVGVGRALDDTLRWQGTLPGFGHSVYKEGDARYGVLFRLFGEMADAGRVAMVDELVALAAEHAIPLPNVDLGLAAITWSTGMPDEAGRTLFTVARVAGWVAHYLEELEERPLRFRARAVYVSPGAPPREPIPG